VAHVSANDRAFELLNAVLGAPAPPGLIELVSSSGLTKPTVRRLFVRQNEQRQYVPGAKILDLAATALERIDFATEFADILAALPVRVPATVTLSVYADRRLLTVSTLSSNRPYRVAGRSASSFGLHATAGGKAILAYLPDADVNSLLCAEPMESYTKNTLIKPADLRKALADTARRGYALNDEESQCGVRCIAVPVRNHLAHPAAVLAMSVATSQVSLTVLRKESHDLIGAADAISEAIGGPILRSGAAAHQGGNTRLAVK
jgi:DNA-binding IclR family transcriptional regulator